MQHSLSEMKCKLLQALDNEYNVVDMDAVLDVITALEQAFVTKDALEGTRIGKYINELRKRTTNEQLARRAKKLVKSWRKLVQQTPELNNDEDCNHGKPSPGGGITVLGPDPGFKQPRTCVSVNGTPQNKTSSSVKVEQSSSPYFSSSSNSPLLVSSVIQGTSLPTNYAPNKVVRQPNRTDPNSVNKNVLNSSNQSIEVIVIDEEDPVSPSHIKQSTVTSSDGSSSNSPLILSAFSNAHSQAVSPTLAVCSPDHNKINYVNKHLHTNEVSLSNSSSPEIIMIETKTGNTAKNILPSESSAFSSVIPCNSNSAQIENTHFVSSKTRKRKKSLDKNEVHDNRIGDMFASLKSTCKLPKVKTTRQIIADLQAKIGFSTVLSPEKPSSVDSLHTSESEVSRTKSELLNKFLTASQSAENESPVNDCSVSLTEYGSPCVPDDSSVINTNFNISYPDPVDEEIKRILSALPPINPDDIDLEATPTYERPTSVTENDLNKLNEHWEFVNGVYDCNSDWKLWTECTEQKSYEDESFPILPYVNID